MLFVSQSRLIYVLIWANLMHHNLYEKLPEIGSNICNDMQFKTDLSVLT